MIQKLTFRPVSTQESKQPSIPDKIGQKPGKSIKLLYPFQSQAIQHILDHQNAALWIPVGQGKTIVTLSALSRLLETKKIHRVLIVAPIRVCESVWRQESLEWEHTKHLTFTLVRGDVKARHLALRENSNIFLINYELLTWLSFREIEFDCIVYDELSKLSAHGSARSKAAWKMSKKATRRIGLTATPATNGLTKLFGQYRSLDLGERLSKYITHFRENYCTSDFFGHQWQVLSHREKPLIDKVKDITYSPPDTIDQLPPQINQDINIKLPPELYEKYRELQKTFLLGDIEAVSAADKLNKLLQFCNGAIYTERKEYETFHDLKIQAVQELVESLQDQPLLLFYSFLSDKKRLKEQLTSSVTMSDSPVNEVIGRWNQGQIPILLAHPASAGHGLNLQHGGCHVAWFGLPYDLELYEQANGRLRRTGQKNPVTIHRILVEDSVEQGVALALEKKGQTQQELIKSIASFCERIPFNFL